MKAGQSYKSVRRSYRKGKATGEIEGETLIVVRVPNETDNALENFLAQFMRVIRGEALNASIYFILNELILNAIRDVSAAKSF